MIEQAKKRFADYVTYFKKRYYGLETLVDLLAFSLLARNHAFLHSAPGHAKTKLSWEFLSGIQGMKSFAIQLGEGTTFEDLFGAVDYRAWREQSELKYITANSLVEADVVLLDEMMDAPPRILRMLLGALNERRIRHGRWTKGIPLWTAVASTNFLPKDERLEAVMDRFIGRYTLPTIRSSEDYLRVLETGAATGKHQFPPPLYKADVAILARETSRQSQKLYKGRGGPVLASAATEFSRIQFPVSPRRFVQVARACAASRVAPIDFVGLIPCLFARGGIEDVETRFVAMRDEMDKVFTDVDLYEKALSTIAASSSDAERFVLLQMLCKAWPDTPMPEENAELLRKVAERCGFHPHKAMKLNMDSCMKKLAERETQLRAKSKIQSALSQQAQDAFRQVFTKSS